MNCKPPSLFLLFLFCFLMPIFSLIFIYFIVGIISTLFDTLKNQPAFIEENVVQIMIVFVMILILIVHFYRKRLKEVVENEIQTN